MFISFSCRLHGVPFIVAFFTPVTLIILGNIVTFCFIIRSLLTSGANVTSIQRVSDYQQARRALAIMVLLGLTWLFGILAIGDAKLAFQYLFCIFNTLQGLSVFILPTETRQQLRNLFGKKGNGNASSYNLDPSSNASSAVNTTEFKFRSSSNNGFRVERDDLQTANNGNASFNNLSASSSNASPAVNTIELQTANNGS